MRRLLAGVLVLLLSGCGGLPLTGGVRDAAGARGDQADVGGIVVVAPGPQPDMSATSLVTAFLYALSRSPQDDHAIARQFLAPGVECCGGSGEVLLYAQTPSVSVTSDPKVVRVGFTSVGRIVNDGSYRIEDDPVRQDLRIVPVDGQPRLASVPPGLWLLQDDLERSLTPYQVHFLGRAPDGSPSGRLVPDRVFLPASPGPAQALVDALLRGPTSGLGDAVLSAAPTGTSAEVDTEGGIVTVDLSQQVLSLDARARQRLSAQLVWTLVPAYSGVRLRAAGEPYAVEGVVGVQDRSDWRTYDPVRVAADAPLLYLDDRKLGSLDRALPDSPVTTGELPVDGAAVSPVTSELAVRTRRSRTVEEVRIGPLRGPFGRPVVSLPGLTSMSWGPPDQGLWVLQSGSPSVVWRITDGEDGVRAPQRVSWESPPGAGPLTTLRVSRDGSRVALVLGGQLHVGRVEPTGSAGRSSGVRIADITLVSRVLVGVTDVAWDSGTSLVALGAYDVEEELFPASVAVDGSSFAVVQRPLVGATAVQIAAAPRRDLVVAADDAKGRRQLYRDDGTLFQREQPGGSPFYPG